ncbi:molybdopterin-dependent oxidoreductase [Paraconexibacter antarcticus]|uniref:molybdopterin-dependent oxidoreductase n=1 Tax=Paraconexibacter antarcticus TaxID=2949664 RepID=UPI00345FD02E
MSTSEMHYRACTLCEAMCGLEIEHAGGEILGIRGDERNHFSKGHICPKGNALQDLHTDPQRIRTPLRRNAAGEFEPVDWDVALDDIADRLAAIQAAHGRDAVGSYFGNPTAHHLGAGLAIFPLVAALGSRNRYSATSQDQLPHSLAALKLFGHFAMFPTPDVDRTDLFLCFGGNPLASNGSVMSAPGFRHRVRDLQARGGRFVVIDPRRTESAKVADEYLAIRPGTDAWLLLAMLHVVYAEGLVDLGSPAPASTGWRTSGRSSPASRPRTPPTAPASRPATSGVWRATSPGRRGPSRTAASASASRSSAASPPGSSTCSTSSPASSTGRAA